MTKLYTLYATPGATADFVMKAPLRIIEEYLGRQVPRLFVAGECSFTIPHSTVELVTPQRVGHWMVVEVTDEETSE